MQRGKRINLPLTPILAMVVVWAALMAPVSGFQRRQAFTFLELNDLHILDEASMAYPSRVVEAMNKESAAFTLVCGDLATDGKREELERAKSILDRLVKPYFAVAGNHDAQYPGTKEETLFREIFGLTAGSYRFEREGVHFVAIDPGAGSDYQRNSVRPEVLGWLETTAATIPDGAPVILFSHYPYGRGVQYRTANADDVLALFRSKKVLAVAGAHFHGNTERIENGVLLTTTASSSSMRANHDGTTAKGFRVFHVGEDLSIRTEFREVKP
jgi:3',5'-cyclic AMP phosphodiesterase CpdA